MAAGEYVSVGSNLILNKLSSVSALCQALQSPLWVKSGRQRAFSGMSALSLKADISVMRSMFSLEPRLRSDCSEEEALVGAHVHRAQAGRSG